MSYLSDMLDTANFVGDQGGDALGAFISGNQSNWGITIDPSYSFMPQGQTGLLSGPSAPVIDKSFTSDTAHQNNLAEIMKPVTDAFGNVRELVDSTFGEGTSGMLLKSVLGAYAQDRAAKSAAKTQEKQLALAQKYKLDQMDKAHEQAQIQFAGQRPHKEFK